MKRDQSDTLIQWLSFSSRKPLVIRGARQVGKTWLIRDFASLAQRQLIELNFEKRPQFESLFASNDPREILRQITALTGQTYEPAKTILFLDEIQAAPNLLAKLRWFAEDMPELPVIAAGSLLDFTLAAHEFSMPVGRISYLYLEPLSFEEFLDALGSHELRIYLENYQWDREIPEAIHTQLMQYVKEYLIIGGMPAAVLNWATEKTLGLVNQIHFDLLSTYRDDFAKYSGRLTIGRLEDILNSVPRQLGSRFVYTRANADTQTAALKQALHLLAKARICHPVIATAANGLPLSAEADEKYCKVILLDCGLCAASLGLTLHQIQSIADLSLINNGGMAEQLVGQLLRTIGPSYIPPSLHYWEREKKGSEAEIDYVIQHENQIIPVEVKAGTSGSLKSLHVFMKEKKKKIGIRFNSDFPSITPIKASDSAGSSVEYRLLSLPFYLVGQLHRMIKH